MGQRKFLSSKKYQLWWINRWDGSTMVVSSSVEVYLLRRIRLMINRLHVLWVVCVVEHLLHCWEHRLIDVGSRRKHRLVIPNNDTVAVIFLTHHPVGLLDNHPCIFNGLVWCGVWWETVVACIGGTAGWWNRAGVNVGIDDRLILLLMVGLVMITWRGGTTKPSSIALSTSSKNSIYKHARECLQMVITDCHEILILIHYCLRIESNFAETVYADTIQETHSCGGERRLRTLN